MTEQEVIKEVLNNLHFMSTEGIGDTALADAEQPECSSIVLHEYPFDGNPEEPSAKWCVTVTVEKVERDD